MRPPMTDEFKGIGHFGGKATFKTDANERHAYSSSRPAPMVRIGVYALAQGVPVGSIQRLIADLLYKSIACS
jgi:hypothetical protein